MAVHQWLTILLALQVKVDKTITSWMFQMFHQDISSILFLTLWWLVTVVAVLVLALRLMTVQAVSLVVFLMVFAWKYVQLTIITVSMIWLAFNALQNVVLAMILHQIPAGHAIPHISSIKLLVARLAHLPHYLILHFINANSRALQTAWHVISWILVTIAALDMK